MDRDARWSLQQGLPGCPRARRRHRRARQSGGDLGPPELRRVRSVLPRRLGVGDAGRRPRRTAPAARPGTGGDRRRLGWSPGVALAANRHPDVAGAVAVWWISGGVFGLLSLASYYCAPAVPAVWNGGMEAVTPSRAGPRCSSATRPNRERLLAQDPKEFIAAMERWMEAYCSCAGDVVPGLPDADALHEHPRAGVPERRLRLQPPPRDVGTGRGAAPELPTRRAAVARHRVDRPRRGVWQGFERWPLLAPQLVEWANTALR